MNSERKLQLYIFLGLLLVIFWSFFIGDRFGLFYLSIFLVIMICGAFFLLIELYLRIQHNIDSKINNDLDDKLRGQNELYEETVSFFDNLLNYLAESKKEIMDTGDKSDKKIGELKDLQGKIVVLLQQILEYQTEQTNFLKSEIYGIKERLKEENKKDKEGISKEKMEQAGAPKEI